MNEEIEYEAEKIEKLGCEMLTIQCPHCHDYFEVKVPELNCCIFRHASFKETFEPIPPHTPKEICEEFLKNDVVYGCTKPFQIIKLENGKYKIQICDYI